MSEIQKRRVRYALLTLLFGGSSLLAQNQKVTVDIKEGSLKQLFDAIEKQTNYRFAYRSKVINKNNVTSNNTTNVTVTANINVSCREKPVSEVLLSVLAPLNLTYHHVSERSIVIQNKVTTHSQKKGMIHPYAGVVTDKDGEPVVGANVMVSGTTHGTVTDFDGKFNIEASEGETLVVSYLGYENTALKLGSKSDLRIMLKDNLQALDEVIVVGYGVMRKSDLTGSVSTVKNDVIQNQPVSRLDQALQGRVAGVQISSTNGAPGSTATIRIRGGNSINAGNEPLYVIDGIIGAGDLTTINPGDIESVEVLRDASSTAIYGSRGANGVIMVTTKRGSQGGGATLNYNGYFGVQTIAKHIDLLNGVEVAEFQNDYAAYFGNKPVFDNMDAIANTNWFHESYKSAAITTDHNLSVTKGDESGNYYFSMNYFNQDGLMYGSGLTRYQIRFNADQNIGKVIKVGATLTVAYADLQNGQLGDLTLLPTAPIYKEDGTFYCINQVSGNTYNSPNAIRKYVENGIYNLRALGNGYLQLNLFQGLQLKSTFGFDLSYSKQNIYQSVDLPTRVRSNLGGYSSVSTNFPVNWQNENTVSYNKTIDNHFFSLLGGFTMQRYNNESLGGNIAGFTNDATSFNAMQTGDPTTRNLSSSESRWSMLSWLFRVNYSFLNRYLLTISGRNDGSSRLASGNKWAFFPSAALAWRVNEEDFIRDLNVFSNLKVRTSYGVSGSQSIDPYSVADRLNSGKVPIGNMEMIGFFPGSSANKNLSWEKTHQTDIGVDIGILENRLTTEIDFYYKKTKDLLLSRALPFQTGFSSILENVGSIRNKGFEISINSVNIKNQGFTWQTVLTYSMNRNKVLDLAGVDYLENGQAQRLIVGKPVGTFFGAKYLGTWKAGEIPESLQKTYKPGDPKIEDLNNDGVITVADGQILGDAEPDFFGGIGNTFNYKGLSLNLFFDFSVGNKIYDLLGRQLETGFNTNGYGHLRNRWSADNPTSEIPTAGSMFRHMYSNYAGGEFEGGCSYFLHNGSYLRLRNVNLDYRIPLKNTNVIKNLTAYASVTNLFTITAYKGFSPDVNSTGTHATRRGFDSNGYPQARTFTVGIRTQF